MPAAAATIVADVRVAIARLTDANDLAAVRVGQALDIWLRGTNFETALGLLPGWRSHLRLTARNRALTELVKMYPELDHSTLATWIIEGLERVATCTSDIRPDGAEGYLTDLARAEISLGWRQWRRLIAEVRRAGHRVC